MNAVPLATRIQRMVKEANLRLEDAQELESDGLPDSDSNYLLRLLAFEILLKAVVRINGGSPGRDHSYRRLFQLLPPDVGARVIAVAAKRMSTSADYSRPAKLLDKFGKNFIRLRYPYEAYEHLSAEEYAAAGQAWAARGGPLSDATFVYHPEELYGLTFALQQEVQEWLDADGRDRP